MKCDRCDTPDVVLHRSVPKGERCKEWICEKCLPKAKEESMGYISRLIGLCRRNKAGVVVIAAIVLLVIIVVWVVVAVDTANREERVQELAQCGEFCDRLERWASMCAKPPMDSAVCFEGMVVSMATSNTCWELLSDMQTHGNECGHVFSMPQRQEKVRTHTTTVIPIMQ